MGFHRGVSGNPRQYWLKAENGKVSYYPFKGWGGDRRVLGVNIVVYDITERKRAEVALYEARLILAHMTRVMAMGELIATIAHEVNQPLGAIVTNGQACLRLLARESPALDQVR